MYLSKELSPKKKKSFPSQNPSVSSSTQLRSFATQNVNILNILQKNLLSFAFTWKSFLKSQKVVCKLVCLKNEQVKSEREKK